jgi:heme/copper-type cytochrome/quinol oxidase subunit 2
MMSIARKFYSIVLHYIKLLIEVFEMLIVLGLIVLIVAAFVFFFKDLTSIRFTSATEELNIVITSITIIIVLIELLRTF